MSRYREDLKKNLQKIKAEEIEGRFKEIMEEFTLIKEKYIYRKAFDINFII